MKTVYELFDNPSYICAILSQNTNRSDSVMENARNAVYIWVLQNHWQVESINRRGKRARGLRTIGSKWSLE